MADIQRSSVRGRPVFVLAFANDRYGPTTGYLRDLIAEQRAIEAALAHAPVEVVARANVTLDDLFTLFARHNDRVVGFHYGGHADPDALFLEDRAGQPAAARIEGLAARLAQLPRLALVVLNGCSTAAQVEVVRARCPAPIIATERAIVDAVARDFAARLYADLAADRPIADAFASAASRVLTAGDGGATRMLRRAEAAPAAGPPWRLYVDPRRPESTGWRISDSTPRRLSDPRWWGAAALGLALLLGVGWVIWRALGGAPTLPPGTCLAGAEVCNGRDDDCDDAADEAGPAGLCGPYGLGRVWGEAACVDGACAMVTCPAGWHDTDGEYGTGCEYACQPSADGIERCNAADDDCDGAVDEGFDGCDLGCDGRDDDGDGRSDEGCPAVRCGAERAGHAPVPPCNGCPDGIEVPSGWVCIPPGEATLGAAAPASARSRSSPLRTAQIERPFLMQATELTRSEWAAVAPGAGGGARPSFDHCAAEPDDRCPVDRVSWYDAAWFANALSARASLPACYDRDALGACAGTPGSGCRADEVRCDRVDTGEPPAIFSCIGSRDRLREAVDPACTGYRLPTHDEWEYAARAGETGETVPGGSAGLEAVAWVRANSGRATHPAGALAPNRWGLYDMLGNVGEWVQATDQAAWGRGGGLFSSAAEASFVGMDPEARRDRVHRMGLRLVRSLPER